MAIKSWFGGKGGGSDDSLSIDDLVALRRYDEAMARLREELAIVPNDLHNRLRLADLLLQSDQRAEALREYLAVADGHAREGFYNKARALLAKLDRLLPDNDRVRQKMQSLERMRNVERRRDLVVGGLLGGPAGAGKSAFQVQRFWRELSTSPLLDRLGDEQLQRLFRSFEMRQYQEDETLCETGADDPRIFLIASGEVAAQAVLRSGKRTSLRTFSPGDLVGDRALLEHRPWPADFVAVKPSVVLVLTREGLETALRGESDPRRFLEALRAQRNDHAVASTVAKLGDTEEA